MKITVTSPINHDGKAYAVDAEMDVADDVARALIAGGAAVDTAAVAAQAAAEAKAKADAAKAAADEAAAAAKAAAAKK